MIRPSIHDCGSFVECGLTIMPHSPAEVLHLFRCVTHTHTHTTQTRTEHLEATPTVREPITRQNDPASTRRTHEVPFIAGREPLTRKKTQGFVPKLPPKTTSQNKAPATSMPQLQCVLQSAITNLHLSTHIATQHGTIHAAIPMRSATRIPKHPITTHAQTHRAPRSPTNSAGFNQSHVTKRSSQHIRRTQRGTFHRRPEPLYPKKNTRFVPKLPPKKTSKTKPLQHPCRNYNAFCNLQ